MASGLEDSLLSMASAGDVAQLRALLATRQELPSEGIIQNALTAATKSSHLDILKFMLHQYPSISLNEEIVRSAVNTGSIPIFETLLAHDPSIINMQFDRRGTPLIVACMGRQRVEYLQFLLEAGADPNQDPDAAAFPLALVAALYSDPAVIDLLLSYGARLESSGALAAAARCGDEAMLLRLFDRGARLEDDAPDISTKTSPLHIAVRSGHLGVVKILLQHGADINTKDARGFTAIDILRQMRANGKVVSEMSEIIGEHLGCNI
jgi:ankyrin repeat protein